MTKKLSTKLIVNRHVRLQTGSCPLKSAVSGAIWVHALVGGPIRSNPGSQVYVAVSPTATPV